MTFHDLISFISNTISEIKSNVLSLFGKSDDAYNEYDLSLTVTGHHFGEDFDPTSKKVYGKKFRVYLGNIVATVVALISALSFIRIIQKLFRR